MRKLAVLLAILALSLGSQSVAWAGYDKGVEFSFDGLSSLSTSEIQNGAIGVKKAMGPDQYLLARLGVGYGQDKVDATATGFSDEKFTDLGLSLGVGVQHYIAPESNQVRPFIGGMGMFSWATEKEEPSVASPPGPGTTTEIKDTFIGFGVHGSMGAEYYFKPSLSLTAYYAIGFDWESVKEETTSINGAGASVTSEQKGSGWDLGPFMGAGMSLTFYWDET